MNQWATFATFEGRGGRNEVGSLAVATWDGCHEPLLVLPDDRK